MQIPSQNNNFSGKFSSINSNVSASNASAQSPTHQYQEQTGSQGVTPSEVLGRSMVNFCGIPKSNGLSTGDNNFADCIGKIFRLNDEQLKEVKAIVADFLKENDFKKISDMYSDDIFEFANEQACLAEQLSDELGLTDYENTAMCFLLTLQVNEGDISKFRNIQGQSLIETNKYVRDYSPIDKVLNKHGVDDFVITDNVHKYLSSIAEQKGKDTVFDLFSPENCVISLKNLDKLSEPEYGGFDKSEIVDIMLEFVELSGMTTDERLDGFNRRKEDEKLNSGITNLVIANEISDKYEIELSDKLLEIVKQRKTESNADGCSSEEIAYRLSEEFDLPGNSADEIIQIIEKYENKGNNEKFEELIDIMRKERDENK